MDVPEYGYYRNIYHGGMGETDYARLSRRAAAYLSAVTYGRSDRPQSAAVTGKLQNACCAVADAYLVNEQGGGVAAETNDGISVTYVSGVSKAKTEGQRLYEAAFLHLCYTGLLYQGG